MVAAVVVVDTTNGSACANIVVVSTAGGCDDVMTNIENPRLWTKEVNSEPYRRYEPYLKRLRIP